MAAKKAKKVVKPVVKAKKPVKKGRQTYLPRVGKELVPS